MDEESDIPKRPYHRRSPQCRLCLREYRKSQLVEIFAKGSDYRKKIFAAVSVKPHRQDSTTRICINCRDIVLVINDFRTACQQGNVLLTKEECVLQSDTWNSAGETSVFHHALNLVERHQREIDAIFNRDGKDISIDHIKQERDCVVGRSGNETFERVICNDVDIEESIEFLVELKEEKSEIEENAADVTEDIAQELEHRLDSNVEKEAIESETEDEIYPDDDGILEDAESNEESESDGSTIQTIKKGRGRKKIDLEKANRGEKVVCPICGRLISYQVLEGHVNRHQGVQPYVCDVEGCDVKLFSKLALQQHRSRHKSVNRYYDCEVCGKRIKGTAYWLVHRKIHTQEPRFSCDICGKKFRRKCKLKVHSTVHSGVAEFGCEICGKFFTVKHNLTAHYRIHMKNGVYPMAVERSTGPQNDEPLQDESA